MPMDVPINAQLNRDEYVRKPPLFIAPLKNIAVTAGQPARFECIVQSHPLAHVVWSKNGYELSNNNRYMIEFRNGVCRFTIAQAFPDDAGVYSCTATNQLGTATSSAQAVIKPPNRGFNY